MEREIAPYPWYNGNAAPSASYIPSEELVPLNMDFLAEQVSFKPEQSCLDKDIKGEKFDPALYQDYMPYDPNNFPSDVFPDPLNPLENQSPSHVSVPCCNEFTGDYNFRMLMETQPRKVANPDWIFSARHCKLYIKPKTPCSIKFAITGPPPKLTYIRAMPVFKQPEYAKEVVRCCPNHTDENKGLLAPAHFIRCDNKEALYDSCHQSGRLSVKIQLHVPQEAASGEEVSTHELFSFVCNNSCGGLNRRPIQVIFTLENFNGSEVMGRCVVDLRVCACPGRDSKLDLNDPIKKRNRKHKSVDGAQTPPFAAELCLAKRRKEDNTVYNLKICGFNNFLILKRIALALELFASMEDTFTSMSSDDIEMPFLTDVLQDQETFEPDSTIMPRVLPEATSAPPGEQPYTTQADSPLDSLFPDDFSSPSTSDGGVCYTYRRTTIVLSRTE